MKKIKFLSILSLFVVAGLTGCNPADDTTNLWDPSKPEDSTVHKVTNVQIVNTGTEYITGVTNIKVTGENFSKNINNMKVWVGTSVASIDPATYSTTQFIIKLPCTHNIFKDAERKDTITVKIGKSGVTTYSKYVINGATRGITQPAKFTDAEGATTCATVDAQGNIFYLHLNAAGTSFAQEGIRKLTVATGVYDKFSTISNAFSGMKMGPNGEVYAIAASNLLKWSTTAVRSVVKALSQSTDFDFDKDNNLWVVTKTGGTIYKLTAGAYNGAATSYSLAGTVLSEMRSVKYILLNGKEYLYIAGKDASNIEKVVKVEISSGALVPANNSVVYTSTNNINAIALSKDGDVYVGVTSVKPLVWVKPDGSFEDMIYYNTLTLRSLIEQQVTSIAGDIQGSKNIYVIGSQALGTNFKGTIFKIYTGKESALYYGRGDK